MSNPNDVMPRDVLMAAIRKHAGATDPGDVARLFSGCLADLGWSGKPTFTPDEVNQVVAHLAAATAHRIKPIGVPAFDQAAAGLRRLMDAAQR